ncbi:MAG: hypothetical protein KAH17_08045 [Bacteroidales bacterium]|nr:hypothetical protein [Bacteroidales bacterium]
MGFVGDVLNKINGIEIYYIAGILIFIVSFIVLIYKTVNIPKSDLQKYKSSILDQEEL